jgi:hypothetical protein
MLKDQELLDLLARVVGSVSAEDLVDDPELTAMLSQLIQILNPKTSPLPLHILEKLTLIDNRMERFKAAAEMLEATDPEKLRQLAESMKESGLLKSEKEDLKRAEKADLVTFPPSVKDGVKCSNCHFVDILNSFCKHPEVNQRLKDGVEKMCCSYWNAPGTKREWDDA